MEGRLLAFAQVYLRLDEVCLEINPVFVVLLLGTPGSAVFLELPCFYNKAVGNLDKMYFSDELAHCCSVVNTLIEPYIEALERLVGVLWLSEFGVVSREVRG